MIEYGAAQTLDSAQFENIPDEHKESVKQRVFDTMARDLGLEILKRNPPSWEGNRFSGYYESEVRIMAGTRLELEAIKDAARISGYNQGFAEGVGSERREIYRKFKEFIKA